MSSQKQNKTIDNEEEINKLNINKSAKTKNTINQNDRVQLNEILDNYRLW